MTQTTTDPMMLDPAEEPAQLSHLVVEAVAEAEGTSPIELDPLATVIDPEALDTLFTPGLRADTDSPPAGEVRFTYCGYEVCVTGAGRVSVSEADDQTEA